MVNASYSANSSGDELLARQKLADRLKATSPEEDLEAMRQQIGKIKDSAARVKATNDKVTSVAGSALGPDKTQAKPKVADELDTDINTIYDLLLSAAKKYDEGIYESNGIAVKDSKRLPSVIEQWKREAIAADVLKNWKQAYTNDQLLKSRIPPQKLSFYDQTFETSQLNLKKTEGLVLKMILSSSKTLTDKEFTQQMLKLDENTGEDKAIKQLLWATRDWVKLDWPTLMKDPQIQLLANDKGNYNLHQLLNCICHMETHGTPDVDAESQTPREVAIAYMCALINRNLPEKFKIPEFQKIISEAMHNPKAVPRLMQLFDDLIVASYNPSSKEFNKLEVRPNIDMIIEIRMQQIRNCLDEKDRPKLPEDFSSATQKELKDYAQNGALNMGGYALIMEARQLGLISDKQITDQLEPVLLAATAQLKNNAISDQERDVAFRRFSAAFMCLAPQMTFDELCDRLTLHDSRGNTLLHPEDIYSPQLLQIIAPILHEKMMTELKANPKKDLKALYALFELKNKKGETPIHIDLTVIMPFFAQMERDPTLSKVFLRLIQTPDAYGRTPMFVLDNVKALRRRFPHMPREMFATLMSTQAKGGKTPLFNAKILEFCKPVLERFKSDEDRAYLKELLKIQDDDGNTIMHIKELADHLPKALVQQILKEDPTVGQIKNKAGQLPLSIK